ncbi:MAG TPA: putative baseplate assembly protein [Micromonosporaceae bacterium]|nr:putative baseplate assembly protein [Micromonosporaceae bacterium]
MALPAPNLDDRRFQDLVDEAKRRVQQSCPEWTDHNVSDPGVTLIETFAYMVDQLIYRLNRVPELNYLRFLDLIGVQLFPPTAAHVDTTFWLSAAQERPVVVPVGTQVSTLRTESEEPVMFTVLEQLDMVPSRLTHLATAPAGGQTVDRTEELLSQRAPMSFQATPAPGDTVMFGLSDAVPRCAVLLRMECDVQGVGVDPRDPPWIWEAWDGSDWVSCEVDKDTTGGFNRPGDVVVHVPPTHVASVLARQRAGWIRCRVLAPAAGQPFYRASPRLHSVVASTIGGTITAGHADIVHNETVGTSDGSAGQRFALARRPVVAGDGPLAVEVSGERGWEDWREVASFAQSGTNDRHFVVDRVAGELIFGPTIREAEGHTRQYGGIPPKSSVIRVVEYRTGGGQRGNIARGMIEVQRDPLPFISRVVNRKPASGGVDGESVREAAARGPLLLRTRDRAVTAEDYEQLAREAAPEAARVRCVPVAADSDAVRILVVPAVSSGSDLEFAALRPDTELLQRISAHLEERRCLGARISVEPPFYQGVTVVAKVRAKQRTASDALRTRATEALYRYLNPIVGGPDGNGWPFGRPVQVGEFFAVLQQLRGVDIVEEVRLFGADPTTGDHGSAVQRLDLPANALFFSYGHQVRVERAT